jgi:mRNA interferase RelE/StbE
LYRVELSREAESVYRWLYKRDHKLFQRIDFVLESLKSDPFQGKSLKGVLKGDYSYRVGAYRIIYSIVREKIIVYVLDIAHRREVYR